MKVTKINKNNYLKIIDQTLKFLKLGGLVVFPSDTVYGLLCDATNEQVVKKLIAFKNRPAGKPISVFSNLDDINHLVSINKQQLATIKQLLPGPFTLILPSKHKVNKLLESERGTLGVRVPQYLYISLLVNRFKKPITATSANLAGSSPHYSVEALLNGLTKKQKEQVDLVVDAGQLQKNKPSTVVDLTESSVKILRQGDRDFSNKSKIFLSKSAGETKDIARKIFDQYCGDKSRIVQSKRPLIFIIQGELGVGKTVFVKGIGELLGIKNIISPTFVIYYEYGNFYHFDLYQIEDKDEFKHLGIEKLLIPGNILCFEWGEKAGEIIKILKEKSNIVFVRMNYLNERKREIIVNL